MNIRIVQYLSYIVNFHRYHFYKIISNKRLYSKTVKERSSQSEKLAHYFGYEEVTPSKKQEKVQNVFTEVAPKYDLMNDVMSLSVHRFWKDYFIRTLAPIPGMKLLDVAGGTGDIAFRFLHTSLENDNVSSNSLFNEESEFNLETRSHAFIFDMNEKMLSICKEKAKNIGLDEYITCIQGNAENLPFEDNTFDAYTIAFGIRNVVHIDKALTEAFRVLKTGGRFLCLEFSQVESPTFYRMYEWYSHEIIPVLGQVFAGNWKAYQYLVESIKKFPNQDEFSLMIEDAGFSLINYENLCNGIAAVHSGYKL